MNRMRKILLIAMVICLAGVGSAVQAQRAYRVTDAQLRQLITRLETRSDVFKISLDSALDESRYDSTRPEITFCQFLWRIKFE